MENKGFINDSSIDWEDLGAGVRRKIMSYDDRLMLVKVAFEKNAIGSLHHHYHTQMSYVASGSFEVQIGEERRVLSTRDVFHILPDVVHGVVCLEAGELIDVFSPMREDFIKKA